MVSHWFLGLDSQGLCDGQGSNWWLVTGFLVWTRRVFVMDMVVIGG